MRKLIDYINERKDFVLRKLYKKASVKNKKRIFFVFLIFVSRKIDRLLIKAYKEIKRKLRYIYKRITKKKLKILVYSAWRLGDEITILPAYKAIKMKYPDAEIDVVCNYPELIKDLTFINPVKKFSENNYDLIIRLNDENPRLTRWENIERKIGVRINTYPEIKIERKPENNLIGISIGAGWKCKRWPVEYFEKLVEYLEKKGVEVWVFGLPSEKINRGKDFTGNSLKKCIENLKKCSLFIGNDSGLLHLSLAIGIPSIGLFGPTLPEKLYNNNPLLYPIKSKIECQGCWNRRLMKHPGICPYGIPECMEKIKVEDVIKMVEFLMNKNKGIGKDGF